MCINVGTVLCLFPHQDDEFGLFQHIFNHVDNKDNVVCVYLTSGVADGSISVYRNNESINVLNKLGVNRENIIFFGSYYKIKDGCLLDYINIIYFYIEHLIRIYKNITSIYVPAWEGGHQDHDTLNAVVTKLAISYNKLNILKQFPVYNGYKCKLFFNLFCPLYENGTVFRENINFKNKLKFITYLLSYKSQYKVMITILPAIIYHYLFIGYEYSQEVLRQRYLDRPHTGLLLYERRGRVNFSDLIGKLNSYY